ncbi:EAL domain-containing protein [Pigmentiphaga litoralis]|uniref:EAL domain-containing protein n=1 Tax=Pigmentiphaga litoralis TaxID=516702 RepID=UPI003B42A4BD
MTALRATPAGNWQSVEDVPWTLARVLADNALHPVFQPIVRLADGAVTAHEALIRGPAGTPLQMPDAMFAAARAEGLLIELEIACVRAGILAWSRQAMKGKLFVNISGAALVEALARHDVPDLLRVLRGIRVSPESLVFELTEHDRVADMPALLAAVARLRACGVQIALDDFGDGCSSLRLWTEVKPNIVKIDKFFARDIGDHGEKVQMLDALLRLAASLGTTVIVEGIETDVELRVIRDLGVAYGQGYFFGRPAPLGVRAIDADARRELDSTEIAVLPEVGRAVHSDFRVERMLMRAPAVSPDTSHQTVAVMFQADESLQSIAIVEDGAPVGMLNRERFFDQYAKPYFKELYGRKPCTLFAHMSPLTLDRYTGIDTLTQVLTSEDQRYLTEGFIITEGGKYLGVSTGEQLVRAVTEIRIEAARHANPLTFLPGNIPISQHIARLLASGNDFVACYGDLNHFKPFNDHYGYWQGDEMIRLVASVFVAHCDARRDFVGHVGGDDFVVVFQSQDWATRCAGIIDDFNGKARSLFDAEALARGGIEAEDRDGMMRFFGFTTLSIGAVRVRGGQYTQPEQVASAAALAKHKAKLATRGLYLEEDGALREAPPR